jgi:hypothetical protein
MEEKPDKKKESIDEILSDLNGLLNKMPSILDGIKMPEPQLPEPRKQEPRESAALPAEPVSPSSSESGEETVVLQPFSGLAEGAPAPAPDLAEETIQPPDAAPDADPAAAPSPEPAPEPVPSFDAEKTVVLDGFSGLPEGSPAPEQLAPQSLGDFMFGQDAEPVKEEGPARLSGEALVPPEEKKPAPAPAAKSLSISEFNPPPGEGQPPPASLPAYENTRDFGIPDIDALMQMSDSGSPQPEEQAFPLPEAGVIPESVQSVEEAPGPSIQGLWETPQVQAASEGGIVENEPRDENKESQLPAGDSPEQGAQSEIAAPSPFDAFAIEPAAEPSQEGGQLIQPEPALEMAQPSDGAETLRLEPSAEMPQETAPENPAEPDSGTLKFESAAEASAQEPQFGAFPDAAAAPSEPAAGGIELSPGLETGGPGLELGSGQPQAEGADQTIPGGEGLELSVGQPQAEGADQTIPGGAGLELSVGQPQAEGADQTMPGGAGLELSVGQPGSGGLPGGGGMVLGGGDATLVVPPPGGAGDEEKTMIFQAGQPSTTSRAQAGDLDDLAAKQAPEGIPAERLRTLMFLYAPEDKALCATALAELDAICLKSSSKPMFIKRAAVKECDPEANSNFIMQSMTEAGAQGLVCLGAVPQEKVYEIENVFNTSGGFFRYYDSSTFSHSAALDLVTDLILR